MLPTASHLCIWINPTLPIKQLDITIQSGEGHIQNLLLIQLNHYLSKPNQQGRILEVLQLNSAYFQFKKLFTIVQNLYQRKIVFTSISCRGIFLVININFTKINVMSAMDQSTIVSLFW